MKDGLVKSDLLVQNRLSATVELERITADDAWRFRYDSGNFARRLRLV